MTAIADAKLQELWDHYCGSLEGDTPHGEAFITALNERLEAADALVGPLNAAIAYIEADSSESFGELSEWKLALAAYRKASP